jgi:hypothetical protein
VSAGWLFFLGHPDRLLRAGHRHYIGQTMGFGLVIGAGCAAHLPFAFSPSSTRRRGWRPDSSLLQSFKRPGIAQISPQTRAFNEGPALRQTVWVSKMACDLKSMSVDELWSFQELATSGRADIATLVAKFRAQQERVDRLDDYCNQTVAEISASLDRTWNKKQLAWR